MGSNNKLLEIEKLFAEKQHQQIAKLAQIDLLGNTEDLELLRLYSINAIILQDYSSAIKIFNHILIIQPNNIEALNSLSNLYRNNKQLDLAFTTINRSLVINPNNSVSFNILANLYYQIRDMKNAIEYYQKALRLNPKLFEAHVNLANCYSTQNKFLAAKDHYMQALEIEPDSVNTQLNFGLCCVELKDYETAIKYLSSVIEKIEVHPNVFGHLADCYLNLGRDQNAIKNYVLALKYSSQHAWHHNLAILYLRNNDLINAKIHFEQSLAIDSNNPTAQYMLNALNNEQQNYTRADPAYITDLFDQYADYYNDHMKETLAYDLPTQIRHTIDEFVTKDQLLNILDLGCGTGLVGLVLRDKAKELFGVDISHRMLQYTHTLNGYDCLAQMDIALAIPGQAQQYFDVIVAAEVCNYFGDLNELFNNIRSALANDGLFIFSIEHEDTLNNDYKLTTSGRFIHHINYIAEILLKNGLSLIKQKTIPLRKHHEHTIYGKLICAKITE